MRIRRKLFFHQPRAQQAGDLFLELCAEAGRAVLEKMVEREKWNRDGEAKSSGDQRL